MARAAQKRLVCRFWAGATQESAANEAWSDGEKTRDGFLSVKKLGGTCIKAGSSILLIVSWRTIRP
jgi:hypothetical protein